VELCLGLHCAGLIQACSHPIEITGQGDVSTAESGSGTRHCTLEEFESGAKRCTSNRVVDDYEETYTATPRTGSGPSFCRLFGRTVPFTTAQSLDPYPTKADFMAKWLDAINDSVANGFLLPEDGSDLAQAAQAWQFPN
jgi:hypothetical protein